MSDNATELARRLKDECRVSMRAFSTPRASDEVIKASSALLIAQAEEIARLVDALTVMSRQRCPTCSASECADDALSGKHVSQELRELYLTR